MFNARTEFGKWTERELDLARSLWRDPRGTEFICTSGELPGCSGLRPHGENVYEIRFHWRPKFWGEGYATETESAVIQYAFETLSTHTERKKAEHE